MVLVLVSVSKCFNHTKKGRRSENSKCGQHWRAFYRNDRGGVKSVTVSKMQAIKLKIQLRLSREKNPRSTKSKIVICDYCGFEQENTGQKTCLECQQ